MYPRLIIDRKKLKSNLDLIADIAKEKGHCSLTLVTKGICADDEIVNLIATHDAVDFMADSRIQNLKSYAHTARDQGKKTILLRLPMVGEITDVIKYADISLNSELATLRLLNTEAKKQGLVHRVVLMVDLGDLREGIFYKDEELIFQTVENVLSMENLKLEGIGTNLTCFGAIIPKKDNLSVLVELVKKIEAKFDIELDMVSGGNSSSLHLIEKDELPDGINNLRLGESFLIGKETAYENFLDGSYDDAFVCQAQIVEIQMKPSKPIGEVGVDFFGNVPVFEDKGDIKRAIIAIGKQDVDSDSMVPLEEGIEVLGGSSDHTILDITNTKRKLKVGDIVSFKLGYSGILRTFTSKYVEKSYI